MTEKEIFNKFATGLLLIRSENGNFNADFSGNPRQDGSGRIYSTDKALKYAIRKYLHDLYSTDDDDKVLFWRRYKEGKPVDFDNNFEIVFKELTGSKSHTPKDICQRCIDVRLFGGTFTIKGGGNNFSITGPVQIEYGFDVLGNPEIIIDQILSPKTGADKKNKDSGELESASQNTIGSQVRAKEVHYSFGYTINPNNLIQDEYLNSVDGEGLGLFEKDIILFKEAMCRGPTYLTSCTKSGSVSELFLYVEFKTDKDNLVPLFPLISNLVGVTAKMEKRVINLVKVSELFSEYKNYIEKIELYYDPQFTEIEGFTFKDFDKINIVTLKKID